MVDALRYDFTVPFEPTPDKPAPHHYHNAFPILYDTAVRHPNNALLLPFIADPPTTTVQRLKGLTTGSLPTFVDAGSNFGGEAIEEDNLIAQLRSAGKTVVHLGDDTWHSLFPGYLDQTLSEPYPSLDVWDLHTVDNGVAKHLFPLLQPENYTKWDFLIAHGLGVDHAGHEYNPDHPQMTAKLRQMNTLVKETIPLIDDDTLLVVMGDHGMDMYGNHGGESDDEVEAALWLYSSQPFFGHRHGVVVSPPADAKERPVAQIDLVPTLSLLLGLPIPFNNLGAPIDAAFLGVDGVDFRNLASVGRITAGQIHRYQQEYSRVRKLDAATTSGPRQTFARATRSWDDLVGNKQLESPWEGVSQTFRDYQVQTLSVCRDLWARFNMVSIVEGIIVLVLNLIIVAIYARCIGPQTPDLNATLFVRGLIGMLVGGISGIIIALIVPAAGMIRSLCFLAALTCCITIYFNLWTLRKTFLSPMPDSFGGWMLLIIIALLSASFGSNSYTVGEENSLLFFLTSFGVFALAASVGLTNPSDRLVGSFHSILFVLLIRLASYSQLCREEQMPLCKSTFYPSTGGSATWHLLVPFVISAVLPTMYKAHYSRTQSWQGSAPFWIGVAFRMTLLLIAAHWILDAAQSGDWFANIPEGFLKTVKTYIAQLVLMIAVGAGTATFAYQAPLIAIETTPGVLTAAETPSGIAARPNKASNSTSAPASGPLIVHGASNLYGSHFAILPLTVVLVPLLLLQRPMGQAALVLIALAILSLLELLTLLVPSGSASTNPSTIGPAILALLGHYAYLKTGHQATLASIQWDAAYIPLKQLRYPWSPIFMLLNTFAGQILCAAAVPLVVLWRRPYRFSSASSSSSMTSTILTGSNWGRRPDLRSHDRLALLAAMARATATHFLVYAVLNLSTTIFAAVLRRHLMLYRVFCPRWMLGVAGMLVAELVAAWIGVAASAWSVGSIAGVFGW